LPDRTSHVTAHVCRRRFVAGAVSPGLALSSFGAPRARAQASGYAAEIAGIDVAARRVSLKGSMGQLTVRVAAGVALDALKPGDKVLVTFGRDGTEPVITQIVQTAS
jgi:Cu/Ag efflux protein CusF